ncbi:MAG TPA: acyltransferase [Candidatus Olsenella pullicola]|nr:acyltransferase [Candidatus Olsenella pullicola]
MRRSGGKHFRRSPRSVWIDALRVLAVLLVVFNHTPGYALYQTSSGPTAWAYLFVTMLTRVNVPLFLMVSGALLLGREEPIARAVGHRLPRILGAIAVFGGTCYVIRFGGTAGIVRGILSGDTEGSYWFLYAYAGMILLLPFLRAVASRMGRVEFVYLLVLHTIMTAVVPMASYAAGALTGSGITLNLTLPIAVERQLFYPLVGYYLGRVVDVRQITGSLLAKLGLAALLGIAASSALTYHQGVTTGYTEDFVSLFDWVSAIAVFLLARRALDGAPALSERLPGLCRAVTTLGPLTFGVYLFDPILKCYLWPPLRDLLDPVLPMLVVSALWCLVSLAVGSALTWLLKRVPVLGRIV